MDKKLYQHCCKIYNTPLIISTSCNLCLKGNWEITGGKLCVPEGLSRSISVANGFKELKETWVCVKIRSNSLRQLKNSNLIKKKWIDPMKANIAYKTSYCFFSKNYKKKTVKKRLQNRHCFQTPPSSAELDILLSFETNIFLSNKISLIFCILHS